MRVGILTEFPSASVQSGPAIHCGFLHDGLTRRGHEVVLMGPDTSRQRPLGTAQNHLFKGVAYPTHPKVKIPFPWPLRRVLNPPKLDVVHGQCNSHVVHYGIWMRKLFGTATLNTHIIHLPTHAHFILSDGLYQNPLAWHVAQQSAYRMEQQFAAIYNEGDGLIVQSRYMVDYWRQKGVTVPITALGRPVNPGVFSARAERDPFPAHLVNGKRLLVVCRHDREKNLPTLIDIFDRHIAPADSEVTLTLVGDGFGHPNLVDQIRRCRHGNRIHLPGEVDHERLIDWYSHADLFLYTSLSETFGNVVNEALWCGLPVVALHDHMGVAHQVIQDLNGFLIEPDRADTEERFALAVLNLVWHREFRRKMSENAATCARRTSHPDVVLSRYEQLYEGAIRRAADDRTVPLAQRSRVARARAFAQHIGPWGCWNALLIGLGRTVTKIGLGRTGTDTHARPPLATAVDRPSVVPKLHLERPPSRATGSRTF